MWKTTLIVILICVGYLCPAQELFQVGARHEALASSTVALPGLYAAFHNQAGLTQLEEPAVGLSYKNRFLVSELSTRAIVVAIPAANGVFGATFSQTGFKLWNETKTSVCYSRKFGTPISAALQFDLFSQNSAENSSRNSYFALEGGLLYCFRKTLIGIHFFNPSHKNHHFLFRGGATFLLSDKLLITAEGGNNRNNRLVFGSGVEYRAHKQLTLRTGIKSRPVSQAFGLSYNTGLLQCDIAVSNHRNLGYTPSVSLSYLLK